MGGAILTNAHGIVSENEERGRLGQCRQTKRRTHVITKNKEGRRNWADSAVERLTNNDRPHRKLANAVVNLSTPRIACALGGGERKKHSGVVSEVG